MKRIEPRIVVIGLLISLGVDCLIPLVHTILDFLIRTNLRYPLTHYLLWGHLGVVLSGIYIGLSKANNKIINGIIVGMLYYIISILFIGIVTNRHLWEGLFPFGYAFIKSGFICAAVAWGTYRIKIWLKTRKLRRKGG
jgi:hypothetical protein